MPKNSPEYSSWHSMKQRCLNRNHPHFTYYGGRGITVDPAWMTFSNFLADMGPKPTPRHSIERMNNAKGYGPLKTMMPIKDRSGELMKVPLRFALATGKVR